MQHPNDEIDAEEKLQDFVTRARRVQTAVRRRQPKPIANALAELFAKRGYGQVQSNDSLIEAWNEVAGPLARFTRAVGIRRGRLEVIVLSSTLTQELRLQEHDLIAHLGRLLPHGNITGLKLKTGAIQ